MQRGENPYAALTHEEQEQLRGAAMPYRMPDIRRTRDLRERPELVALGGLVAGLAGVGLHQPWLAAAGAFVTCAGLVLHAWVRLRANRLARALAAALAADDRTLVFEELARVLGVRDRRRLGRARRLARGRPRRLRGGRPRRGRATSGR